MRKIVLFKKVMIFSVSTFLFSLTAVSKTESAVLSVPSQFKSIQAAIDAASSGDVVQVYAGIYKEQVKLKQGIILKGEGYEKTIIDGGKKDGYVITGANDVVLEGFTIRNSGTRGRHGDDMDAGIKLKDAAMSILNNRIVDNNTGILLYHRPSSSASVEASLIANNIIENSENYGIYMIYAKSLIENNIIYKNKVKGIFCTYSIPEIVNNTIVGNSVGISTEVTSSLVKNNIIMDSKVVGLQIAESLGEQEGGEPYMSYNVYWKNGHDLSNVEKGTGDITKDPMFADIVNKNFRLEPNSPAINTGDPDTKYNDSDGSRADIGAFGGPYAKDVKGKANNRDWAGFKKSKGDVIIEAEKNYTAPKLGKKGSEEYREQNTSDNYYAYCAPCHGRTGKGDGPVAKFLEEGLVPRDHTSAEYFSQKTDEEIFNIIKYGGAKYGFSESMSPFEGLISDEDISDLVKFIRGLCNCQYQK